MENNKFLVPSAIILAGVLVAGAIVYTRFPAQLGNNNGVGSGTPPPVASAIDALKIRSSDFVLGNPAAKVAVVEYGDFQCPFCGKFYSTTEKQLRDTYVKEGKAVFVWRDFAFLGEESFRASEAARCAGDQGKFWDYHDYIFTHQNGENEGAFADANLKKFAQAIGLDAAKFNSCFDSKKYRKAVEDQSEEGRAVGVTGTPTTFINGRLVSGAVPFSNFQKLIDEELK